LSFSGPLLLRPRRIALPKEVRKKNSQENPPLLRMVGGEARFNARFFRTLAPFFLSFFGFFEMPFSVGHKSECCELSVLVHAG